jgi:hypothetical protein
VMSLLLELEEVEQSSRRNWPAAGSTCFCLRRDRGLPILSRTGGISRAMRTILPAVIFGLGRRIDQGRLGCASWHRARCLSSFLVSVEQQTITRETRHEPRPVSLQTTRAQTGITMT